MVCDLNTGLRDANLRGLRWDSEIKIPVVGTAFRVLEYEMNAGIPQMVFLNSVVQKIIERQTANHHDYDFTRPNETCSVVIKESYTSCLKRARSTSRP